ncbi:MAG: hypothetical protein BWK76_26910 [Desulfobulbaceae bacterium A2]|nr:MAG: hypothetical protein BWK76_26910 [Desulfobulbaceae bacterium A2]
MRLLLLSMPWAPAHRPSIQLAALQAYLRREAPELTVVSRHPYLPVARALGFATYQRICEKSWAGEALYSGLLFPELQAQSLAVAREQLGRGWSESALAEIQQLLAAQLAELAADPLLAASDLLGISVCFNQLTASLAAARMIKERYPGLPIVLGGSTCTPGAAASLLREIPTIDHVISGEGETPLLRLIRFLQGGDEAPGANVFSRGTPCPTTDPANCQQHDLDRLPLPDFDDYFAEIAGLGDEFFPELPVEFSRGCWWNRCAFCNLNLQWHGYRAKSAERMWAEIDSLRRRYHCLDFSFTDNALPPQQADAFFRRSAASGLDLRFFGEIRATVAAAALHAHARGGLQSVQIGIEALSDSLLLRMRKGVRTIDNLAAMKHALAAGMRADGNLILEFPSSTEAEVAETLACLELVLPYRPLTPATFFLGQGSPVWRQPREFGIQALTVHPVIRRLFPPRLQQHLDFLLLAARGDCQQQRRRWRPVRQKMDGWRRFHQGRPRPDLPALGLRDGGDFLLLRQERPEGPPLRHRLRGLSRRLYLACDSPRPRQALQEEFSTVSSDRLHAFLVEMQAKGLLFADDQRVLALAVPEDREQKTEVRSQKTEVSRQNAESASCKP